MRSEVEVPGQKAVFFRFFAGLGQGQALLFDFLGRCGELRHHPAGLLGRGGLYVQQPERVQAERCGAAPQVAEPVGRQDEGQPSLGGKPPCGE